MMIHENFEWDEDKAERNQEKHGVSFDAAASVLLDRFALTVYDDAHSQREERWFTLGLDGRGNLLAVARTYEIVEPANVHIRIISARKATGRERRYYEDEPR